MLNTSVGYAGGTTPFPTYRDIGDHFEAVLVEFDPTQVSYTELLEKYFRSHDPTRRSSSKKNQYNPGAWTQKGTTQAETLRQAMAEQARLRGRPLATTIGDLPVLHYAENYHQKYSDRTLLNGASGGTAGPTMEVEAAVLPPGVTCGGGSCTVHAEELRR